MYFYISILKPNVYKKLLQIREFGYYIGPFESNLYHLRK
jgi:hypothetical protein